MAGAWPSEHRSAGRDRPAQRYEALNSVPARRDAGSSPSSGPWGAALRGLLRDAEAWRIFLSRATGGAPGRSAHRPLNPRRLGLY